VGAGDGVGFLRCSGIGGDGEGVGYMCVAWNGLWVVCVVRVVLMGGGHCVLGDKVTLLHGSLCLRKSRIASDLLCSSL